MEMQQEKYVHKPMLDVEGQVQHLKDKGITFQLVNDEEAKEYLRNNNYYFKLTSYRKNYEKLDSKYKAIIPLKNVYIPTQIENAY